MADLGKRKRDYNGLTIFELVSHPCTHATVCSGSEHQKWDYLWNRLIDVLHEEPDIREMYYRRLRTLMDELLVDGRYEARIDELAAMIATEAAMDIIEWGQYGESQDLTTAVNILKNDYLAVRRTHLFSTHRIAGEIPESQSPTTPVIINEIMYNPVGTVDDEFVEAVDKLV